MSLSSWKEKSKEAQQAFSLVQSERKCLEIGVRKPVQAITLSLIAMESQQRVSHYSNPTKLPVGDREAGQVYPSSAEPCHRTPQIAGNSRATD